MSAYIIQSAKIISIQATTSTCANNGTITVNATTTNPPLIYSITPGPSMAPVQTNNIFSSPASGTYTIKVSDGAGNFLLQDASISGDFLQPDFDPIKTPPYCPGGSDGINWKYYCRYR